MLNGAHYWERWQRWAACEFYPPRGNGTDVDTHTAARAADALSHADGRDASLRRR